MIKKPLFKLTAVAAVIISTSALAQETEVEQQDVGLETIIVTSERIANNLQTTPVAVSAFSEAQIDRLGAQGLEDLKTFVPNFTISEDGDYGRMNPQFNIRGVGAGTSTAGIVTEKPVGLYIDGIYLSRAQGSLLSVIDAQSIEVLRGPQGTLFGRNATGGAVSYTSKKPHEDFESSLELTVGDAGRRDATLSFNVPLSDKVFFRGVLNDGSMDGFVDRGGIDLGNRDESVYRGQLRILASDDVTVDFSASHSTFETNGDSRVLTEFIVSEDGLNRGHFKALESLIVQEGGEKFVTNDPRIVQKFSAPAFCVLDDANPYTFGDACDNSVESDITIVTANVEWIINNEMTFKSLTGFTDGQQKASSDFPWSGAYNRPFEVEFESFSQEFQLQYRTDKLDFVSGLIIFNESGQEDERTIAVSEGWIPYFISQEDILAGDINIRRDETYQSETDSYGIYAQGTYKVTDKLKATAGLRYSHDKKTVDIAYNPTEDDPRDEKGSGSESWGNTDYRLALAYQYNDDIMFYASVSEAYKAGIANDASLENRANVDNIIGFVPPEEALGLEVGVRSQWMDDRFRANFTVFTTDYTNRQGQELETIDGQLFFVATNLGDVEYKGFEGELAFQATESLTLTASFGLVDYKQVEEPENALPYVPEESFSLGILHYTELSNNATVATSLNYGWNGEMWAESDAIKDESLINQSRVPSYGILNGRIEYMPEHDNWSVGLYVNNLLDEYYWTSTSPQEFHFGGSPVTGDSATTANLGRDRNYGITVTVNF